MGNLLSTLIAAMRSKVTALWNKIRLFFTPAFWKSTVTSKVMAFFQKLFDVRPKHKKDYYPVFRWLVSKRLAYALVIACSVGGLFVLWMLAPNLFSGMGGGSSIRTYKYNSIPLKFYEGTVQVLAHDGHVAYIGQVSEGAANGSGTLKDQAGNLVYEGQFAHSMYNGTGTTYYSDGTICYAGTFTDNLYNGVGQFYRPTGIMEYDGDYVTGRRTGTGTLYNSGGNAIFTGPFQNDEIVYSAFLGKTATEAGAMYTGTPCIYTTDNEYAVEMREINAVYAVSDGANSIEQDWTITGIYVLQNEITLDGEQFTTIDQLSGFFGDYSYAGSTWVDLAEAVSFNLLDDQNSGYGKVDMDVTEAFDEVRTVNSYDDGFEINIYTFERDGLMYTFYCDARGTGAFTMYAITQDGEGG